MSWWAVHSQSRDRELKRFPWSCNTLELCPQLYELMLYVTLHHIFIEGRPSGECRLALKSSFPSENGATSLSSHCTSGNILTLHLSAVEILSAGGLFENLKSTHTCLCLDITCFTLLHNHTTFIQVAKKYIIFTRTRF